MDALRERRKTAGGTSLGTNVAFFVAVLFAFVVGMYAWNKDKPKEASMFSGAPPAGSGAPAAGQPAASGPPVRGVIELAPEVAERAPSGGVLFIILRNAGMPPVGPPVAVKRYPQPQFPLQFEVTSADVMMKGMPFSGPFDLYVRLDRDGNAMTKDRGDLKTGEPTREIVPGGDPLRVKLDRVTGEAPAQPPSGVSAGNPKESPVGKSAPARVSGTIDVAAGLKGSAPANGVVFIIARNAGMPPVGPPAAVARYSAPAFPLRFELTSANVMMKGMPFNGPFDLYVRLDADGNAMTKQAGDISVSQPAKGVALGTTDVTLTLDDVRR